MADLAVIAFCQEGGGRYTECRTAIGRQSTLSRGFGIVSPTMNSTRILILVGFLLVINASGKLQNLKICVVGNPKLKSTHTTKYCDLLGKSKRTPVSCLYAADRLECLSAVSKREADFTILEAEDLYFATKWSDSSILVVSEIKASKKLPVQYGTVVLVRKSSNINGIGDLRGKRLCHPGFDSGSDWNSLFAQYLEERVAPANCEENLSVFEDRIKTTSDFFGSACKAGPWVVNKTEDARLKGKYWSLCALCDSGDCRNSEKYRGSGGSIMCLKYGVGDVLWARYEDVKVHLKFLESSEESSDYHFLCDDGSVVPLTDEKPCLWLAKPWKVVGANRKSSADVQKIVDILGDDVRGNEWEDNLLHVIELYLQYIENVGVSKTPEDYLRNIPGYLSASAMSEGNCNPKHSVRLCVSSTIEEEKCLWMSKAAAALAIQPSLSCVPKTNFTACLKSVAEKETDVVVVSPDHMYDATMKFNLKSFLVEAGNEMNDSYLLSVVVRKKSEVSNLSELRGKKVCFTRRNGIGWKSVVAILRQEHLIDSECRDHEGLSEFFGGICVVSQENEEDLPACCPNIDDEDKDEVDMLRCLQKDGCDVAALDFNSFNRNKDTEESNYFSKYMKPSDFRAICKDAKECHWMWSYPNYLMTSSEVESFKEEEIFNFFYQLGQFFGRSSNKNNNPMLEIFGPFNKVRNVIFKDTSAQFVGSGHWNQSNNYHEVVERMKLCSKSSSNEHPALLILASLALSIHIFGNS